MILIITGRSSVSKATNCEITKANAEHMHHGTEHFHPENQQPRWGWVKMDGSCGCCCCCINILDIFRAHPNLLTSWFQSHSQSQVQYTPLNSSNFPTAFEISIVKPGNKSDQNSLDLNNYTAVSRVSLTFLGNHSFWSTICSFNHLWWLDAPLKAINDIRIIVAVRNVCPFSLRPQHRPQCLIDRLERPIISLVI